MKKYFSGLITGLLLAFAITGFAATPIKDAFFTSEIKLNVNGKAADVTFVNVDGSNYGKVRDIAAAMGGTTAWDEANQTINVTTTSAANTTETKEVKPMSTTTTGIDLTQWINPRDLKTKYSLDIYAGDNIVLQSSKGKISFESSWIPTIENQISVVKIANGTLSIQLCDGILYFKISDLVNSGLISQ